jgi:hypothetical protein
MSAYRYHGSGLAPSRASHHTFPQASPCAFHELGYYLDVPVNLGWRLCTLTWSLMFAQLTVALTPPPTPSQARLPGCQVARFFAMYLWLLVCTIHSTSLHTSTLFIFMFLGMFPSKFAGVWMVHIRLPGYSSSLPARAPLRCG